MSRWNIRAIYLFVVMMLILTASATAQSQTKQDERLYDFSLVFFYQSTCPYCHRMSPVLKSIQDVYGVNVYAIAVDAAPLDNNWPEWQVDTGYSQQFNVTSVPHIIGITDDAQYLTITQGFIGTEELLERLDQFQQIVMEIEAQ